MAVPGSERRVSISIKLCLHYCVIINNCAIRRIFHEYTVNIFFITYYMTVCCVWKLNVEFSLYLCIKLTFKKYNKKANTSKIYLNFLLKRCFLSFHLLFIFLFILVNFYELNAVKIALCSVLFLIKLISMHKIIKY